MTKKAYRKFIAGHFQWSVIGLLIALIVAFVTSDHRSVVYGMPAAESSVSGVPAVTCGAASRLPFIVPASAPKELEKQVVPDTINGELVWSDPWDQIDETSGRVY